MRRSLSISAAFLFFSLFLVGCGSAMHDGSSGNVIVASTARYVYFGDTNQFQIDAYKLNGDGTLAPLAGSPFSIPGLAGTYPWAASTIAEVGNFLYVNATFAPKGISGFRIDPSSGSLTPIANATEVQDQWFLLVGDSRKNVLYASGEVDVPSQNAIEAGVFAFSVGQDGTLTRLGSPILDGLFGAIAVDPQGRFFYQWNDGTIYVFDLNADGSIGSQVSGSPFRIGTPYDPISPSDPNACFGAAEYNPELAADPSGRYLYAGCDAKAQVDEIAVSNSGQLTVIGTVPMATPQSELSSLLVSHDGSMLFGTEEEMNSVVAFAIDRSNGTLGPAATVNAGNRPNDLAADISNRFLYVTNASSNISKGDYYPGSNNVSEYSLTSSGTMKPLPDSPKTVGSRPAAVIVTKF